MGKQSSNSIKIRDSSKSQSGVTADVLSVLIQNTNKQNIEKTRASAAEKRAEERVSQGLEKEEAPEELYKPAAKKSGCQSANDYLSESKRNSAKGGKKWRRDA